MITNFSGYIDIYVLYIFIRLIGIGCTVLIIVLFIILNNNISKSFGHGAGFTVGLVLLNTVFLAILAFGCSKYKELEKK